MSTQPIVYSTSAALLFTEQELGGPCTEFEAYNSLNNVGGQVVAKGNGDRVGLLLLNIGSNDCYISLTQNPSLTTGITLPGNGGLFSCNVRDDFTLPSREWSAIGTGATILYVLEIVRFTSLAVG